MTLLPTNQPSLEQFWSGDRAFTARDAALVHARLAGRDEPDELDREWAIEFVETLKDVQRERSET